MKSILVKPAKALKLQVVEDTQFVIDLSGTADGVNECSIELEFSKEGVTAEVLALYKLEKKQSLKLSTVSWHRVPNTSCKVMVKGVLMGESRSNYVGKIKIEKPARETSSFLQDDILVMGEKTKNSSQPILEIETNDVRASHGATTGRVSNEQIYYLMSRGLSKEEAEVMVVTGFMEDLVSHIVDTTVRENLSSELKLGQI